MGHWGLPDHARYTGRPHGPLAQLGERRLCTAEVRGSTPLRSTEEAAPPTAVEKAEAPPAAEEAAAPPAAEPVFDEAVLLNLLGGDHESAAEIVHEFLADVPRQVEALRAALAAGDAAQARMQAHTLKGASANVGAGALRAVAYRAEKAAADGDLELLGGLMPQIERQAARLQQTLEGGAAP